MAQSFVRVLQAAEAPLLSLHIRLRSVAGRRSSLEPFSIPILLWVGIVALSIALTCAVYTGLISLAMGAGSHELDRPFTLYTVDLTNPSVNWNTAWAEFKELYLSQFRDELEERPKLRRALRDQFLRQGTGFGRLAMTAEFAKSEYLGATGTLTAEDVIGTFRPGWKVRDLSEDELLRKVLKAPVPTEPEESPAMDTQSPSIGSAEQTLVDEEADKHAQAELARRIVISLIGSMRDQVGRRTLQMFCDWIQGLTVWAAFLGLLILAVRWHWARAVAACLRQDGPLGRLGAESWAASSSPRQIRRGSSRARPLPIEPLVQRVALTRFESVGTSTRATIDDLIARWIGEVREAAYTAVDFLLWLVPTLGFVGTIVGITAAMIKAPTIVEQGDPTLQAARIRLVGSFLGTAFDTTFVALVAAIPMTWLRARTEQSEVEALTALGTEAERRLPPKFDVVESDDHAA